jgi:hypothetical protein
MNCPGCGKELNPFYNRWICGACAVVIPGTHYCGDCRTNLDRIADVHGHGPRHLRPGVEERITAYAAGVAAGREIEYQPFEE